MMSTSEFLTGKLLVTQPCNNSGHFSKGVVLVAQHSLSGAWGVIVNRPAKTVNMQNIMAAAGIDYDGNETIYVGGTKLIGNMINALQESLNKFLQSLLKDFINI